MKQILVIRLKAIGDVIFTLPAVAALQAHYPGAEISFLTSRENAPLLRGFPQVRHPIPLDRAALRSGHPGKMAAEFFGLLRRLRGGRFSLVVDFQGFGETAWLSRLTGAPQRWGSVYGPGRRWAYTHGQPREEALHPAEWNLQLLRQCGVPCAARENQFVLPADAAAAAREFYVAQGLDPGAPTLVVQPFTSSPQKNWPLENYLAVARHWRQRGIQVIFAGGPGDRAALEPARQEAFSVAAGTPLLVSAGLVQLATLTVGGDTGLGHLAVAQGRRVVMLMMAERPGACVPFGHPDWAVVPPRPGDIRGITVDQVVAETSRLLPASSGKV